MATAFTSKVTLTYSDGSPAISGSVTQTSDAIIDRIETLVAGEANLVVDTDCVYTRVKEIFLLSTQDATVLTNASTGVDTFTLKATVPYWWSSQSGVANPLTADITTLYMNNGSGTLPAQIDVRILYDSTP
jgi:hypothetical protein